MAAERLRFTGASAHKFWTALAPKVAVGGMLLAVATLCFVLVQGPSAPSDSDPSRWASDPPLQSATSPAPTVPDSSASHISERGDSRTSNAWPEKHNSVATKPLTTSPAALPVPPWTAPAPHAAPSPAPPPLQTSGSNGGMADSWSPAGNSAPFGSTGPTNLPTTTSENSQKIQGWPEDFEQDAAPTARDDELPFNRAARAWPYSEQPAAKTALREPPPPANPGGTRFNGTVHPLNSGTDYR